MADGLTTVVGTAAVGIVGNAFVAKYFPGLDLDAVVGAFGGALCFVLFAKNMSALQRIGYLIVGWIGGYYASAEILAQAWTKTSGLSSFIASLITVVVGISIIEAFETGKWPAWLQTVGQFLLTRFFGKGKPE